jgi:hypothetical protein
MQRYNSNSLDIKEMLCLITNTSIRPFRSLLIRFWIISWLFQLQINNAFVLRLVIKRWSSNVSINGLGICFRVWGKRRFLSWTACDPTGIRNLYVCNVSIKHILASAKLTEYNRVRKIYVRTAYLFNLRLFDVAALATRVYAVQNWIEMDVYIRIVNSWCVKIWKGLSWHSFVYYSGAVSGGLRQTTKYHN